MTQPAIPTSPSELNGRPHTAERVPPEQLLSIAVPAGLTSILVPCCGQLEYTKLCVPAVLRHTRPPFELIFLDIGSLDGTADYLQGLAAGTGVRVEVVHTATDLGIAAAVEDALKLARGEYLALVNNDCLVTDGWLAQLVGLAKLSPTIGLVGPLSNYAAPPQLVEQVPYRVGPARVSDGGHGPGGLLDVAAVDGFARQWRDEHRGQWQQAERLRAFCLLVKCEVLKRIGHLREAGDLALFDTDLLGAKARQAGFTLAVCKDLFVHHFGTRTFAHGAPGVETEAAAN
jgi:GT2 family glycosyltransferase